ncbi:hypothetical protein BYT27DRAFT_7254899 [Phlegmacium glaucopus]|nr:hypothetical protein BYT27DRAFT_7254899 [Phlegmacium glaucopus]
MGKEGVTVNLKSVDNEWVKNNEVTGHLMRHDRVAHRLDSQNLLAMLAATTPEAPSVADPSKAPSSIPSCLCLLHTPVASFWSPDNSFLYLSSAHTIHKYDPSSNTLKDIYTSDDSEAIRHLVAKDRSTVIFDTGDKIHVLECGSNPKVSQVFEEKASVTSLSNDNSLLASTSANAVQLLVAAGKQILIYDTTRPSVPIKTITLTEAASGNITAIACSPFSKTLIAAATSGGFIGLIDLEKEEALFRTLNIKIPLTTIGFSPEGAVTYVGTENGKILVIDLRALDKPPKAVVVSETSSRIETMSIQRKVKSGTEASTKTPAGSSATTTAKSPTEPLPTYDEDMNILGEKNSAQFFRYINETKRFEHTYGKPRLNLQSDKTS